MFERTIKVMLAEQVKAWDVIKRAADDCDRAKVEFTAASTIAALREELDAAGMPLELSTCKDRLGVASFWWDATNRDQAQLERVGWTIVRGFWKAGWTPEAAAGEIRAAKGRLTQLQVQEIVNPGAAGVSRLLLTDAKVEAAVRVVMQAIYERERGTYRPSPDVALMLDMVAPVRHDWDAALKELDR